MNIKLSYPADKVYFKYLFPEDSVEVIDLERDKDEVIDLLIFPGGEDVSLSFYLDDEDADAFRDRCYVNPIRDNQELEILYAAMREDIIVKKILGVCRGTQFLNVMFDGTLFPDLPSYGINHGHWHKLRHNEKSNLSFFQEVNSLHHQGIRNIGYYFKEIELNPRIIAYDEGLDVIEMASWQNERILGIQFHPEYYDLGHKDRLRFSEFIRNWIVGSETIF